MFSHVLHGVLLRSFVFGAASAGLLSLLPVYAKDVLGTGRAGSGLLYAGDRRRGRGDRRRDPSRARAPERRPRLRGRQRARRRGARGARARRTQLLPAFLISLVAGVGWLFCLSTLNVASQEALPGWVRARGLAFYLTAISAGIAMGAVLWGGLANVAGAQVTYAWSALAIVVTLALARRWRFDRIAEVDLRPAPMAAPEARLVDGDEAVSSPALVVVAYEVRPEARTTSCARCAWSAARAGGPAR